MKKIIIYKETDNKAIEIAEGKPNHKYNKYITKIKENDFLIIDRKLILKIIEMNFTKKEIETILKIIIEQKRNKLISEEIINFHTKKIKNSAKKIKEFCKQEVITRVWQGTIYNREKEKEEYYKKIDKEKK